jgi:hypothetical protein
MTMEQLQMAAFRSLSAAKAAPDHHGKRGGVSEFIPVYKKGNLLN